MLHIRAWACESALFRYMHTNRTKALGQQDRCDQGWSALYLLYVAVCGLPHVIELDHTGQGLPGQLEEEKTGLVVIATALT